MWPHAAGPRASQGWRRRRRRGALGAPRPKSGCWRESACRRGCGPGAAAEPCRGSAEDGDGGGSNSSSNRRRRRRRRPEDQGRGRLLSCPLQRSEVEAAVGREAGRARNCLCPLAGRRRGTTTDASFTSTTTPGRLRGSTPGTGQKGWGKGSPLKPKPLASLAPILLSPLPFLPGAPSPDPALESHSGACDIGR